MNKELQTKWKTVIDNLSQDDLELISGYIIKALKLKYEVEVLRSG
jgi:hypothetical protein